MAQISKYPFLRHLRSEPSRHVIHYASGTERKSGPGLAFWFRPLSAAIAELPIDDRELPFLFHGRSKDFQDVTVQGIVTWRVADPDLLARRVDFSISLSTGRWREQPLEHLSEILSSAAQQHAWSVIAGHDVRGLVESGVELVRERVRKGLFESRALADMGLEVIEVSVSAIQPTPDLEQALQTPTLESIQQQADEAVFKRRALAVDKERAIAENELSNRIELAARTSELIAQEGDNQKRQAHEESAARAIRAEAEARLAKLEALTAAENSGLEGAAEAERIAAVEGARAVAERERMEVYAGLAPHVMLGLAAREFAGKLERVEHLSLSPDGIGRISEVLADLFQSGSRWLDRRDEGAGEGFEPELN